MKVDGKEVNALQWLRETGGNNAIKRFSENQTSQQATQKAAGDHVTLSREATAALKAQMQFNKASVLTGISATTAPTDIYTLLAQQKAAQATTVPQTVQPAPPDTNQVEFNNAKTNKTQVTGNYNTIDFRANAGPVRDNTINLAGEGNLVRGYNGGQKNNTMTVAGDTNRLYAGQGVAHTAVTVKGSQNTVNLGTQASNNAVSVTGNNVKVSIGSAGQTAGSNQNWKINVAANDVEVAVVNGTAQVNMADELKSKYKVTIDDAAKTVSVTAA
jgi:hypothetical protein